LQEAREETLKQCKFGDEHDREDEDVDEEEKRHKREENIDKIRDCEKVVLDFLIDRSKLQCTENLWTKETE
jgi:hypothetical protein